MTGSRMFGGTGLGLSIAKELIDLHGGKINVSSVLGKGTEFTVMVPTARKVFHDTIDGFLVNSPLTGSLHRAASAELLQIALDMGLVESQLSELDEDSAAKLLTRALERDEPQSGYKAADRSLKKKKAGGEQAVLASDISKESNGKTADDLNAVDLSDDAELAEQPLPADPDRV
jgi:hypothetical protein